MLEVAFFELGARRVVARVDARNTASRAVLERLGMRQEGNLIATTTRRSASVSLAPCSTSDRLPQDGAPQADNQWLPAQRTRSRNGQGRNLHPGTIGDLELKIPILVPGHVVTNDILAFMGTGEHESVDSCDPSDLKLSLSRVPRWARTGAAQGASCETPIDPHTRGVSVQLEHLKLFAVAVPKQRGFSRRRTF